MKTKVARRSPPVLRCMLLSMVFCLSGAPTGGPARAWAMSFVLEPTPLAKELADADFVVLAMLYGGDAEANTTEAAILSVIKDHPALKDKQHFTLNRYVSTDNDEPKHVVIFGAAAKGGLDAYRGITYKDKDDELIGYLKDIQKLEKTGACDKLAYYFKHLESPRSDIAVDAFLAFRDATYSQIKFAGGDYDAEKLKSWIADDNVPAYRKELYQVLLVFCQKSPKR